MCLAVILSSRDIVVIKWKENIFHGDNTWTDEDGDGERYSNNYWRPQPDAQTVSDGQAGGFDCLIAEVDTANEDRYLVEGASCAM